jgi:hypothetical protein
LLRVDTYFKIVRDEQILEQQLPRHVYFLNEIKIWWLDAVLKTWWVLHRKGKGPVFDCLLIKICLVHISSSIVCEFNMCFIHISS